jgi:acid phosphatase (class B)
MRKITLALSAACLLFSLNSAVVARASAPTPLYTGTTAAILAEQAPIHWVSVAQIENSLMGRPPMAVGFDIDDTVCSQARASGAAKKCTHRTAKRI